ncbi:ABC transporter ATP-binding protein [Brumimicrobium aurantiacum]|uniref:ATP-binding cassette domain-containing protein n=1 Tax=Brumimicrobium aurantiacum TaxID=1737063 RepID=A0A3E1F056_9FLAO|nr:ATP-binding cassette domain-containing protein [Brumimicrobium aurantiacum]RFC55209.1 ATP-binding cassette domain-containing protein [Brumimicrobium aurantiacum]
MIQVQYIRKEFELTKKQQKENNTSEKVAVAVNDISFECKPGRIFSLLGPNGAGKTTTLRMLAGILQPTSGSIQINEIDIQKNPNEAKKDIGFLTGSTGLYERLTANEIISYFAKLYGVSDQDFKQRKEHLYELLGMHDFQDKRIGRLSTGMKQKVSIARTMIHDPKVVIFDEPTSGLDVITAENIIKLISDCKEQGKTVIFSSHIMSEVDLLCDDLAIIHKGNIVHSSTMEEYRNAMTTSSLTAEFIKIINENN